MIQDFQPKKLVKIPEAAKLLGVSERWVWFRIKDGSIPVIRLEGTTRIALSDLETFVQLGRAKAST
jgi:excisionase family DNA binding protein